MATYTDLQNKVKETINVGYKDRTTTQEMKLYNEQNEYWGTFKGTVVVDDVAVDGGKIKNVEIYDSALCGQVTLPGGVDLAKIGYALTDLCGTVENINDTVIPAVYTRIGEVNNNLTGEVANRKTEITRVEGLISASNVSAFTGLTALEEKLTTQDQNISSDLCAMITTERKERIENDVILNTVIGANRTLINAESNERAGADSLINSRIDAEVENSIVRDDALCARLIQCEDDTEAAIALEHAQMLSTVCHDRHYALYGLADELKNSYPYQIKDYAVNVLKTAVNDGIVVSENQIDVGTYNVKDGKTYLHINTPLADSDLEVALIPDSVFTFTGSETHSTGRPTYNSYSIRLDDSSEPTSFVLNQVTSAYYEIHWTGDQIIGTITDFVMSDDKSEFLSGKISIYPAGVPELTPFACEKLSFSQEAPLIQIPGTTEEILFNLIDKYSFQLRKGVYTTNYCPISSVDETTVEFAEILSGNTTVANNEIVEMLVNLKSPFISNDIALNIDNGFVNVIRPDYILSASTSGLSAQFELVNRQAYFNYNVYLSDDIEYAGRRVAKVIPGKLNTELSSKDYVQVSAVLDNFDIADKFKGTYQLYDDTSTAVKVWKAKKIFEDEASTYEHVSWIYVEFDGENLNVSTWNAENGTSAERKFIVKQTRDGYANVDAITSVYKSNLIPVTEFSCSRKVPTYVYDVPSSLIKEHPEETHKQFKLFVDKTRGGKLEFEIPAKTSTFKDISREFLLVLNVISSTTSPEKYVCDFGSDITIFADKSSQLSVSPGMWATYQFNEIAQNVFLVTDLNDVKEYEKLRDLSTKVDSEIDLRTTQYNQLSTAISNNISSIDDLYKQIQGGLVYQDLLSLDVEIERIPDVGTFRGLFAQNIKNSSGATSYEEGLSVRLRNGFYWIARSTDTTKKYNFDSTEVRHGDLIIIKENTTVQDITASKVSIIDIMDKDAVHEDRLCEVSTWLSSDYHKQIGDLSTSLSVTTALSVKELQKQIISNDADITYISSRVDTLCSEISNDLTAKYDWLSTETSSRYSEISTKVKALCTEISTDLTAKYEYLSNEISANDKDIIDLSSDIFGKNQLSDKVEFLLSTGHESMTYFGTVASYGTGYKLYDFLSANFGQGHFFKQGFMFRLSATQKFYEEGQSTPVFEFNENDYFIFNKDCLTETTTSADINVIRDSENETSAAYEDLISQLSSVSSYLSSEISKNDNDITYISSRVDTLCSEISNDLTAKYKYLSTEISTHDSDIVYISSRVDTLCSEISNDLTAKYKYLSDEISANDSDIAYISGQVSTTVGNVNTISSHYDKTFEKDYHVDVFGTDVSVDVLKMTDEALTGKKYTMHLSAGTIVMIPVK